MSVKRVHQPVVRYDGLDASNAWTEGEKRVLLKGLRKYGHTDIQSINKILPNKSSTAIKNMINSTMMAARRCTKQTKTPPIDMWLDQATIDETNALIPQALFFISLFERHPSRNVCKGCDLRAAYDFIYRLTRGHPALELPTKTRRIVYKLISKTVSKIRSRASENLLRLINNLYKSTSRKDYTRRSQVPRKIGPFQLLQELNTFVVPSDQLRSDLFS